MGYFFHFFSWQISSFAGWNRFPETIPHFITLRLWAIWVRYNTVPFATGISKINLIVIAGVGWNELIGISLWTRISVFSVGTCWMCVHYLDECECSNRCQWRRVQARRFLRTQSHSHGTQWHTHISDLLLFLHELLHFTLTNVYKDTTCTASHKSASGRKEHVARNISQRVCNNVRLTRCDTRSSWKLAVHVS
jgi:hypothetical protein